MEVRLTNCNSVAVVDEEDYERVAMYSWHRDSAGYAVRFFGGSHSNCGRGSIRLHRFVLNAPPNLYVDHKNGDKLDNTRDNLRLCTPAENCANRNPERRSGKSKYKGVYYYKAMNGWTAIITKSGKRYYLGTYSDEKTAALAYDEAARRLHGRFAWVNLPQEQFTDCRFIEDRLNGVPYTVQCEACGDLVEWKRKRPRWCSACRRKHH